jgi:uncharacterized protein (DUF362 family)
MVDELTRRALLRALGALGGPARLERYRAAIAAAVRSAGGLPRVPAGALVVVKVNCNSGDPAPYSSSPTLVQWVVEAFVSRGARVLVGDRSFWGDPDTAGNLERNGIAAAARAAGATVVPFEDDTVAWTTLDAARLPHWVGPVRVPSAVFEAACVVNLACAKTHFISGVTLGLKNVLGFVHADDRKRPGNLRVHVKERLTHQVAELHDALPIHFTIIDAFQALVTGGPTPTSGAPPTIVHPEIVLADVDSQRVEARAKQLLAAWAP